MSKLLVVIIFSVLIVGATIYVMAAKILPATGGAGTNVSATIQNSFS